MNVLLTFDVEVWCNSWKTLDADFPNSFERYVYGRSEKGDYALPKTLEILEHFGLRGVFFVEPLFATRFGVEPLAVVIRLIRDAGQEIQLHLHPEWTDEARSPLLPDSSVKRQFLTDYTLDEQRILIQRGIELVQAAGAPRPIAFRAGSFACNEDTFAAVAANGLRYDSSINPEMSVSRPGGVTSDAAGYCEPFRFGRLSLVPMSSFRDGFGRLRHAQIGACSASEMIEALTGAARRNWWNFVLLSHNFELLVPDSNRPDDYVVRRFEKVCRFLAANRLSLPTVGFDDLPPVPLPSGADLPHVRKKATLARYVEQALRRLPT